MSKQNNYWFKRRRYGWGWTPVTWQGWLTIGLFLTLVIGAANLLPPKPQQPTGNEWLFFLAAVLGAIFSLLIISFVKGPAPRWRWGKKSTDNPDEDY